MQQLATLAHLILCNLALVLHISKRSRKSAANLRTPRLQETSPVFGTTSWPGDAIRIVLPYEARSRSLLSASRLSLLLHPAGSYIQTNHPMDASNQAASPGGSTRPRLLLPPSCNPPMPNAPTSKLVWLVSGGCRFSPARANNRLTSPPLRDRRKRSLAGQATWAAPS